MSSTTSQKKLTASYKNQVTRGYNTFSMDEGNVLAQVDGPELRPLGERCLVGFGSTGGPPMLPVFYNNNYQIVQNRDHV